MKIKLLTIYGTYSFPSSENKYVLRIWRWYKMCEFLTNQKIEWNWGPSWFDEWQFYWGFGMNDFAWCDIPENGLASIRKLVQSPALDW